MADRAFGRLKTDRLPRLELGLGLCADMDSVRHRHHRVFRGRYVLFNPQTQEVMKQVTVKTITTTSVDFGGIPVDHVLEHIARKAHEALESLSMFRNESGIEDNNVELAECALCNILDTLSD